MSYMKLIKLLYIVDRTALLRWGRPVTTDSHVSMDRGPVLSRVRDLATDGEDPGTPTIWSKHISEPANYEIHLQSQPGRDELSDAEWSLIDEVFKEHGRKSRWELVDWTHKLPEWKDPHGSAIPITYRDILRAGNKTEVEIAAILDELESLFIAENFLGAR
ncbi:MAG: Panacea domain-containing protein [Terriglobia bacterium]